MSKLRIGDLNAIDSAGYNRKPRQDSVVMRLVTPIPKCQPYDVASDDAPFEGQPVIALTILQEDQPINSHFSGNEPLAYPCKITKVFPALKGASGGFWSDCDVNRGGSGGFALARRRPGEPLLVLGLFSSSGKREIMNGLPYNEETGNVTLSAGVDGDFPRMLAIPGTRRAPDPFPSSSTVADLHSPSTVNSPEPAADPRLHYATFARPAARLDEWITPDGLRLSLLRDDARRKLGIDKNLSGVLITDVKSDVERTRDWQKGDVITAIDDGDQEVDYRSVRSPGEIKAALDHASVAGRLYVAAEVKRGDKYIQLNVYVDK